MEFNFLYNGFSDFCPKCSVDKLETIIQQIYNTRNIQHGAGILNIEHTWY